MKRKVSRILAVVMALLVTITTATPANVYASQTMAGGAGNASTPIIDVPSTGETAEGEEVLSEEEVLSDEEVFSEEEVPSEDEILSEETVSGDELGSFGEKGKLNYLYLENKFIETPGEQTVLVGFGDEETVITSGTLELQNYDTKEILTYSSEDALDSTVLFNMEFSPEEKGIYEVIGVTVRTEDGKETKVRLSDTGMAGVYFGVDEEFTESAEDVDILDAASIEMQVVSLDESISEVETENITAAVEEALDAAQEAVMEEKASRPRAYSEVAPISAGGKLVVVLDPGHDATHAGASANGLKEEELTLKIAQYCKAELEQYNGVTVYMTRNSASCPYPGTTSTVDNYNRVQYAKSVGADIYVSIHLNSAGSSAMGAEVYYPNSSYNSSIGTQGANLATQILRQLKALGLTDRGIKIRNSEDNSLYPDGSLADYYGVIKNSKLAGFPGVIIEHAFVTNASDAAFLKSEANLKNVGIADATGIANYLGLSKIKITSSAPVIQNVNNGAGTFEVSVSGVSSVPANSVSNLRVAVWSVANGQDDLKWYTLTNAGGGNYKATIDLKNHNYESGVYNVHVYATDTKGGSHFLGGLTSEFKKPNIEVNGISTNVSADEKNVTITATGVTGVSRLRFAVWSVINGQDDLIWYDAKDNGNGTWSVTVPISAHKGSTGVYNVHAYGSNAYYGETLLKYDTFTIAGPQMGSIKFQTLNEATGSFSVNISGVSAKAGVSSVEVAIWSKANQSNLKWYTAVKQSDGTYKVEGDISNHGYEYGTYQIHVYVKDSNGASSFGAITATINCPKAVVTAVGNANQTQFNIKASNVGMAGGVKGVRFAVWSTAGGQDDLIWYNGTNNGNGVWSTNAIIANHKTAGTYNAHVYVTNANGDSVFAGYTTFTVKEATVDKLEVLEVNEAEGTFTIKLSGVKADAGIKSIEVAVWSKSDQSNLKWYTATRQNDGSYVVYANLANHGYQYGLYNIHAYVTDNNNIKTFKWTQANINQPKTIVTAVGNTNQTQFNIKASNVGMAGGVKGVRFAVWSTAGGQDDLIWYNGTNNGNGVWSTNAIIANHKTAGTYNAHVYVTNANGDSVFAGYTTFTVDGPKATSVSIYNVNEADGTFGVKIDGAVAASGIKKVEVAVWSAANQSDLVWYTATNSGGVYSITADVRNHKNNTGTYNAHVYITDNNGIRAFINGTTCKIINVTNILHPIMGSTSVTVDQMIAYYNSSGATYPNYYADTEASTLRQFCQIYIDECNAEGVKAEVAFVQAMKETNFLRYGGDVNISQFNFAGIGATGGGVPGNSFGSVTLGIRAQVQHLKAYASNDPLNKGCVDPRFQYVTRNTAPYCEWLGINENPYKAGWATAVRYGYDIVDRIAKLKSY